MTNPYSTEGKRDEERTLRSRRAEERSRSIAAAGPEAGRGGREAAGEEEGEQRCRGAGEEGEKKVRFGLLGRRVFGAFQLGLNQLKAR
jgi:hypothetical protein